MEQNLHVAFDNVSLNIVGVENSKQGPKNWHNTHKSSRSEREKIESVILMAYIFALGDRRKRRKPCQMSVLKTGLILERMKNSVLFRIFMSQCAEFGFRRTFLLRAKSCIILFFLFPT